MEGKVSAARKTSRICSTTATWLGTHKPPPTTIWRTRGTVDHQLARQPMAITACARVLFFALEFILRHCARALQCLSELHTINDTGHHPPLGPSFPSSVTLQRECSQNRTTRFRTALAEIIPTMPFLLLGLALLSLYREIKNQELKFGSGGCFIHFCRGPRLHAPFTL